jgi:hypothetical protein
MRMFLTQDVIAKENIGVGDDVFMVGRFMDYDGGTTNRPAARFGNISVMLAPIKQPNGRMADCYCIDLHSRTGYSGSPVFMYRLPWQHLNEEEIKVFPADGALFSVEKIFGLLGIHFAQFPEEWELRSAPRPKGAHDAASLITEGAYVKGLSGMSCVLPGWNILEVLNLPPLAHKRGQLELEIEEQRRREGAPPDPEGN